MSINMISIRPIHEDDVKSVIELYRIVYGDSFPFQEFYDAGWIKKGVFDDNILWCVAENKEKRLIGSAAVMLNVGDQDDLIGEFGRLVVHPESRGQGTGGKLIQSLFDGANSFIEFGFAECRTAHTGAQKIFTALDYNIAGFEPLAYDLGGTRESMVFVTRLCGNALRLRKNNPHIIPEVHSIGSLALRNCGIDEDLIVDKFSEPYPIIRDKTTLLADLDDRQVYRVLRLTRGLQEHPEVFGGFRLEYGFLKLKVQKANFLVLKKGETIQGGLGYVWDDIDSKVSIFEMVNVDDTVKGTLLERGIAEIEMRHNPVYIQVDVNAHSPRIQQTLNLLGFAPVAYCPSMVYTAGERLDVIKMVKLRVSAKFDQCKLTDGAREAYEIVVSSLAEKMKGTEIDDITRKIRIFRNLTDLQAGRINAVCREIPYRPGEWVFQQDSGDHALFIVMEGKVDIILKESGEVIDTIEPGEVFGEMALIEEVPRSAGAVCREKSKLLVIRPDDFDNLVRADPLLGSVIMRNIAQVLSERLRQTGIKLEQRILQNKTKLS